jgi:hypothetical protein
MLPELLERVDQRVLQLVERCENAIGEGLAQMSKDLLGRVEFWTVAWQIERMHAPRPAYLAAVMTARTIHHDPNGPLSQFATQMPQEEVQALAIHVGQQQKDTGARSGFHCRIEPEPLVLVLHDPRWTFPQRTPTPSQPGLETKTALIECHHALESGMRDQAGEVFLKAACCSALAFLWRRRPVFHLTRCFLNSHHSDLPFLYQMPHSRSR